MPWVPAEAAADKYHGVVKFDVATGTQQKGKAGAPNYQNVYAKALIYRPPSLANAFVNPQLGSYDDAELGVKS